MALEQLVGRPKQMARFELRIQVRSNDAAEPAKSGCGSRMKRRTYAESRYFAAWRQATPCMSLRSASRGVSFGSGRYGPRFSALQVATMTACSTSARSRFGMPATAARMVLRSARIACIVGFFLGCRATGGRRAPVRGFRGSVPRPGQARSGRSVGEDAGSSGAVDALASAERPRRARPRRVLVAGRSSTSWLANTPAA
ncbi:hypothetical protein BE17_11670 [Sorangium cellulosum]|uniref:Uncharacterized protein n=1 Tax=Sorangium cellulosum TaxID=56 RepID=A0A150QWR4_SORCE|nr:hypothetical protein BE17_11670 [Sorangium cellulosum]